MHVPFWYARALRLLPRGFVDEFGADMTATFLERAADAREQGRLHYLLFRMREAAGLLRTAAAERRRERLQRRGERGSTNAMETTMKELSHAARRLMRTPGFTFAAVLTLALALGANGAIFTLVKRVALAPLPYFESDRLIAMDHGAPGLDLPSGVGMSPGMYREYSTLPSHESISLYASYGTTLSGEGGAERLDALLATPSLARVLGVRPALGRWFTEAEGERDGPAVVILTHEFWRDRFGGDPGVVGRTLRLDGNAFEVVGVMPRGFSFPDQRPRMILPLQMNLSAVHPGGFNFRGVARLAPGVSVEQARADQNAVIADLPSRFPDHPGIAQAMIGEVGLTSLTASLKDNVVGDATRMLWVLLAAVAVVLLIACANIANLFLVRTDTRQREVAVRRALGAGSGRIAGYFVAETALVCAAAAAIGIALASAAIGALGRTSYVRLPRLHEVRFGADTVIVTVLLALVAAAVFGLMPMLRRSGVLSVLQESGRGNTVSGVRMRSRHALMAMQVALAVTLLIAAGLLVRSFAHLRNVNPGFVADTQLTFRVGLPESQYRDNEMTADFHEQVLERIAALPGVQQVALTTTLPLDGDGWGDPYQVRGRPLPEGSMHPIVRMRRISTDYLAILSIPLVAGRGLDASDASGISNAALIDRTFAEQYFPGEDPIGRHVKPIGNDESEWLEIVGIVGNTATYSLRDAAPTAKLYLPLRSATTAGLPTTHSASYVVRAQGDPLAQVPAMRRAIAEVSPEVAMARVEPLQEVIDRAQASMAFTMLLIVTAASVALLLGVIGVYAVISYGVAQRRNEIGVRIALGAQPADVTGMIVKQNAVIIGAGIAVGLVAAVASTRLLGALLFGVRWNDVPTYAAVAGGLFLVAIAACWLPARRAAQLNPTRAIQQ